MLTLSNPKAQQLAQVMGVLAAGHDPDSLRERLVQPLAQLLDADQISSFVWRADHQRFDRGVTWGLPSALLKIYETELQFEDPIAAALRARRGATKVSDVIPARQLTRLPFFERFLATAGLHWGVNVFAFDGAREVGDLRIWRGRNRPDFGAKEMSLLHLLHPALEAALSRPASGASVVDHEAAAKGITLDVAGLSPRELEVARLVASGERDKVVARRIGIAVTTVRTHLASVLRKTRCRDRRDLMLRAAVTTAMH